MRMKKKKSEASVTQVLGVLAKNPHLFVYIMECQ